MSVFTIEEFDRELREYPLKVQLSDVWISLEDYYSDLDIEKIEQLTAFVCDFLEVEKPHIKLIEDVDNVSANTVFVVKDDNIVVSHVEFLKRHLKFTDEGERILLLQSIAHEVRHIWQLHNNMLEFKTNPDDLYSYTEIDAIAFSRLFLEFFVPVRFTIEDKKLDSMVIRGEDYMYTNFLSRIVKGYKNKSIKFQCS